MFAALKSGNVPVMPPQPETPVQRSENFPVEEYGQRRRPQVKVFNIPEGTDQEELKSFFSVVGDVKYAKILPTREGKTTTLGFVEFETEAEIQKAVTELNNVDFHGSQLRVMANKRDAEVNRGGRSFQSTDGHTPGSCDRPNRRPQVKVFNIPDGSDEGELRMLFSQAGDVKSIKVLPCREGKDVTLGFVQYVTSKEVDKAVALYNDWEFNGSKLRVMSGDQNAGNRSNSPADLLNGHGNITSPPRTSPGSSIPTEEKPSRSMGRGAQLLANIANLNGQSPSQERQRRPQAKVFGFPEGTTQDDVKQFFSSVGVVKFVKLLPIREGKDTHLGFVEFDTEEEVSKAVECLDGQDFNGSKLKVMTGSNQTNVTSINRFQNGGTLWASCSASPTGRIPREERDFNPHAGRMENGFDRGVMVPDYQANACRRCGESGHWAKECVNAPISDRSQAVTYIPPPPPETEEEIFQQGIDQGINFEKYECIPVELTGNNTLKPVSSFEEAEIHEVCRRNVIRAKYNKPTPVQKYAIPAILARRDLMACAQTGSGKTASFLLPVITNLLQDGLPQPDPYEGAVYPLAAVLSPTRELAVQIFQEARKFSYNSPLKTVVIYGGISVSHQTDILRLGCHLLVATPGRLDDFVKRGKVSFRNLRYMILDEADRMLDMGFGPQIDQIIDNSEMPPKGQRTTLMFSATFPETIQQMAAKFLKDYLFLTVGRVGGTCADVLQTVIQVPGFQKRNTLEQILQESGTDRTLVFVERKRDADFLASFLSQRNYPATSLNADRSQQERELALKDFRAGIAPVLVATAVAGRGLDINDVKHVINYDLPNDATEYVHRIGRTGRIGNKGKATSFFDLQRDQKLARSLVKYMSDAEQDVPNWLEECALSAVGTGYGSDGGQFHDRRERYQRNTGGVASARFQVGNSNVGSDNKNTSFVTAIDEDEEEW